MCDTQSYKSCSGVLQPPHDQVPPSLPTRSPQLGLSSELPPPSGTAFQEALSQPPSPPCVFAETRFFESWPRMRSSFLFSGVWRA